MSSSSSGILVRQFGPQGQEIDIVAQIGRIQALQEFGIGIFGSIEAANEWLRAPHSALQGISPAEHAVDDERAGEVHKLMAEAGPRDREKGEMP
ncbi:MAG: antitoxin Xre/MbcA/ParS toxin-binding domain-containing protein [Hylemonella sp.]